MLLPTIDHFPAELAPALRVALAGDDLHQAARALAAMQRFVANLTPLDLLAATVTQAAARGEPLAGSLSWLVDDAELLADGRRAVAKTVTDALRADASTRDALDSVASLRLTFAQRAIDGLTRKRAALLMADVGERTRLQAAGLSYGEVCVILEARSSDVGAKLAAIDAECAAWRVELALLTGFRGDVMRDRARLGVLRDLIEEATAANVGDWNLTLRWQTAGPVGIAPVELVAG